MNGSGEFGFTRLFPKKYVPGRTKASVSVVELFDIKLYDQAAYQLLGEDLAEKVRKATQEVRSDNEFPHTRKKYPFAWSCIR